MMRDPDPQEDAIFKVFMWVVIVFIVLLGVAIVIALVTGRGIIVL